ncbi:hypothetical protein [Thiohalomonas denitrificans]|uniref:Uncharacterized protein n=1 Tax=Thiohalomonas denitrificans TaxID=415747 RepID=A0A1G5QS38_9GAMM|nr:hypothetical protein [Thiohalomonas denitrificans]SCZ64704.1 hypothetical protein SAMN03097708_02697 [Thiohalomonas denitrificans]
MVARFGDIQTVDVRECVADLPSIREYQPNSVVPDIFICALGFEKRAPTMVMEEAKARKDKYGETISLLGEYTTNLTDNARNEETILDYVSSFSKEVKRVNADDPRALANTIMELVDKKRSGKGKVKVSFDISAASENFIISVVGGLIAAREKVQLRVLYVEAESYHPTKEKFDIDGESLIKEGVEFGDQRVHLEYGVQEVEWNELFPGFHQESHPDYVIAIPTFRMTRMIRCLNEIGEQIAAVPARNVFWILGQPPSAANLWRADYLRGLIEEIVQRASGGVKEECQLDGRNSAYCSTLDYKDVLQQVVRQADQRLDANITLVNMGSKMQALGVGLALAAREEIAVITARPVQYNVSSYSMGVGPKWEVTFELGEVVTQIRNASTLKYLYG